MKDNELIEILKEFDEKRVEQLNDNARKMFYAIMDIANQRDRLLEENEQLKKELQKYKSLYQNEKDHTDTLKRIIKKIEEYINEKNDWEICSKYDAIYKDEVLDILDLLKEIK